MIFQLNIYRSSGQLAPPLPPPPHHMNTREERHLLVCLMVGAALGPRPVISRVQLLSGITPVSRLKFALHWQSESMVDMYSHLVM